MSAGRTPMLIGAGAAVVAVIAGVIVARGSSHAVSADVTRATASAEVDASVAPSASLATASASASPSASASASPSPSEAGAPRPPVVSIDESSEGKTIELSTGQSLVLMLGANPTTGFDWSVLQAPAALGAPAMGYIPGGDQMGAPGKRRITWTVKSALPAGEHAVELGYARSFEKGVAPFKTFRFKVRAPR